MSRLANELKDKGIDVINMSLGRPDFHTPDFVKAAAKEAVYWKEETTLEGGTKETEFGTAYLTELSTEAPAEGVMTFSGTLSGIGTITETDQKPVV